MDYTVQASVVVIAQGLGAILSGYTAARLGYANHLLLATILCALPIVMVARWPASAPDRFALR